MEISWDYRIVQHDGVFTVHEVHYNDRGGVISVSEDPMGPSGETIEELKEDMGYFLQAFDRPVLRKEEMTLAATDEGDEQPGKA